MAQKGKMVFLLLIILIAAGFIIMRTSASRGGKGAYQEILVDVSANKLFVQSFSISRPPVFPVESPHGTGKNSYPAMQCDADRTIFALDAAPMPEPERLKDIDMELWRPLCPVCGESAISKAMLPEGTKSVDVQGPVQIVKIPRVK